mmetsp:Transcript_14569/g.33501  ORF Transcript_14569/g.33501 Transcript_14569/m.33501 type:complete len:244 (-) Transcript_14569:128-859(-)
MGLKTWAARVGLAPPVGDCPCACAPLALAAAAMAAAAPAPCCCIENIIERRARLPGSMQAANWGSTPPSPPSMGMPPAPPAMAGKAAKSLAPSAAMVAAAAPFIAPFEAPFATAPLVPPFAAAAAAAPAWLARMPTGMMPMGMPSEVTAWPWRQSCSAELEGETEACCASPARPLRASAVRPLASALPFALASAAAAAPPLASGMDSRVVSKRLVLLFRLLPVFVCRMKYFCAWLATCVGVRV